MVIKVVKKKFVTRLDPRIKIKSQIKKIVNSLSKSQKGKHQNGDHKNLRTAEVGGMFSTDAPFAKSILHVFTSVAIHVALYTTTKYCSNKVISSSYISLFYCTDASFTNACNFWKKFSSIREGFLLLPNIDKIAPQPLRA